MPKKRVAPLQKLLPVLHIYCEGEKTEPIYINNYIYSKFPGDRRRSVIKIEPTKKNTPIQLVEVAVEHKNSRHCPPHDVFWVVYDRESTAKYPDALHLEAYQLAKAHKVNLALSNVCFELWLYLHFQRNTTPFSSCDDFMAYSRFKAHLASRGVTSYEKGHYSFVEAITMSDISNARTHAKSMNNSTLASAAAGLNMPHQLNPYTDMHLLLDAIDIF